MINLQENYYTLPPEAYTFSRGNIFQKKCTIAVSYTDSSGGVYILGDTFLRNFVTTFDYESGEMQLTINVNAPAGVSIEYKMSGWKIFGIIAGCILFVILVILVIWCCIKKQKKAKLERGYQTIATGVHGEISQEPLNQRGDDKSSYKQHWGTGQ